jgi:single-strand DNA-binding protein
MDSWKTSVKVTGEVERSALLFEIMLTGKSVADLVQEISIGDRVAVRGRIVGDERGGPYINADEEGNPWTAFSLRAYQIYKIAEKVKEDGGGFRDLQTVGIAGNVGKDSEMRYIPSGAAVTTWSLASNYTHKVDGENVKETIWWRCTAWERQAEIANEYIRKGMPLLIDGLLQADPDTGGPRLWERRDGTWGASYEITVTSFRMIGKRDREERPVDESSHQRPYSGYGEGEEESVPF